ncbi:MAG: NAD-glutamate dehydrogenase [Woeseiaceae bacterium]|nr:NAD-glutamate dehydrogenase [Woeseiaceae bacterium]
MAKTPQRRKSDIRDDLIERIVASRVKSKLLDSRKQITLFLREYFRNVPYDDLAGREPALMARAALDHLGLARKKRKDQPIVHIFNPTVKEHGYESAYTIVEMVNDDMPFIVDSVSAAINRQNLNIHITVHPILRLRRDKNDVVREILPSGDDSGRVESFVRFAIDKETEQHHLDVLEHEILRVLGDVRAAVRDWLPMRLKMQEARELMRFGPSGADAALRNESQALLQWMIDDHFTFLGYREYALKSKGSDLYLNPVSGTGLGLLAQESRGGRETKLTPQMKRLTRQKDWLIITKANSRSTVHRHSYLDYVGVKRYDEDGKAIGEMRFLGLFTSVAYSESPRNIPLLRLKVRRVIERSGFESSGHLGKALTHILDNFPRDELFQASVQDLTRTVSGILNLQERHKVRLFVRRDTFRRFYSCIVYVPREKYTTAVRRKIEKILLESFGGTGLDTSVEISDSALARAHIIVRVPVEDKRRVSVEAIEKDIAEAVVTWRDRLRAGLDDRFGVEEGHKLFKAYGESFSPAYEGETDPSIACLDVKRIDGLRKGEHSNYLLLHQPKGAVENELHFRTFRSGEPFRLSYVMPVLEDLGVEVYGEQPYRVLPAHEDPMWIQDFELRYAHTADIDVEESADRFQECFHRCISGDAENDGFNRLVLAAGLTWREVALIRCYGKYLQQLRIPFSQDYLEDVLVAHADVARLLVEQFRAFFDPALSKTERKAAENGMRDRIRQGIQRARTLDEDRILRAFAGTIDATLRTNFFQRAEDGSHKDYISIKLDPFRVPGMPRPRPKYEIFVYSPDVEGVHLRGGAVARGGLRWSDRREDFRTEVLGLMKAQVVKNTVIVPTGAKGGFVPKRVPEGDRDVVLQNGIACYRKFISGLLDITDNVVDGKVVTPKHVIRRDGDDPYLVVAADKGTATFSDIANEISTNYGFWLDDAFASGGSAGYDHKKMGITARGAWEAVRRHFREQGVNVQTDPFTVAGIGDMSGDVFGNGMLLSKKIRLVAAFNHEHIFLDPDPDPSKSFRERQRLFRLSRSRWSDYDEKLISKGGGVFSRQAKEIKLSPQVRELLDVAEKAMTPTDLIRSILRMQVDLLWNGGIGTYVKASFESDADAGDRSNDDLRVNGNELRCKVVGEGGNLGLTQHARIEYSLNGGRINTDFIDNSAGVDSSDREVNIKILLGEAERLGRLNREERNELLAEMTDDVARFVLRNNYLQTQAISMMEARAVERIDETARLIVNLEKTGRLDRDLEFLPDETEIDERRRLKQGFTRPEIAVVLSYAKIDLYDGLTSTDEPLDDFLAMDPQRYFPEVLRQRYHDLLPKHRLSREILATLIANNIVNRMGPAYVQRMQQDTRANVLTVARAYVVAREVCQASEIWQDIEALDNKIPASLQLNMMFEVSRILRHACYWLIDRYGNELDIVKAVEHLKPGMATVYQKVNSFIVGTGKERQLKAIDDLLKQGVPDGLAKKMAGLLLTRGGLDIADLAAVHKQDTLETAKMYANLSQRLGVVWLHRSVENLEVQGRWQAMARGNLRDEFYAVRRELSIRLLRGRSRASPTRQFEKWTKDNAEGIGKFDAILEEMQLREEVDFATLSVAAQELRRLIAE